MIRILITLLALTLGAPTISQAGTPQAKGFEWLGATCCGESEEFDQQPTVEKACCCRPSPISQRNVGPQALIPTSIDISIEEAAGFSITRILPPSSVRIRHSFRAARAPPRQSLVAQHTLLQV